MGLLPRTGSHFGSRTSLAWRNLVHRRWRTVAALAGVGFTILLLFMQIGFYDACVVSATRVHEMLEFDAVVVSTHYVFLLQPGSFPDGRLALARSAPGVASAEPLLVGRAPWRNAATGNFYDVLAIGVAPDHDLFRDPSRNGALERLSSPLHAVVDRAGKPILGPLEVGTRSELRDQRLEVVADFEHGTGFVANGTVLVNPATFRRVFPEAAGRTAHLGLISYHHGSDPERTLAEIARRLPEDVVALSRAQLERRDRRFYLSDRPLGLIFTSGVAMALGVGALVLFQILASDISHHLGEFATLKAIGYRTTALRLQVLEQGALFGLLGFVPAALLAALLYALTSRVAGLPLAMSPGRLLLVLGLTLAMCGASALLAIRRLERADPAELFP
ncbi:MAG: hypothetical protein DWQ36_24480 [Acidobacteria bacterium]|nr:MAG: hypothetical protein DWQ30_07675 [Acidobacteriota bacterium]REK00304.1 MAG: hypothetical protein DWQ36_24480 [Acidobacteriota bacterium]